MNILMSANKFFPDIGGIENIAALLAQDFSRAGHSVRLVTQTPGDPRCDHAFPFHILRRPNPLQLFSSHCWAHVCLQINLEARQLWPHFLFKKPLVIGLQCWSEHASCGHFSMRKLKHMSLGLADCLIACSTSIRDESAYPAVVIGNPYDNNVFILDPDAIRSQSIVFLGRLVHLKGADVLLKAFEALSLNNWRLSIIGDGPERQNLEHLAYNLGIHRSVDFLGPLQGKVLANVLNRHEIMVIPSRWREPFGIVALEGSACGCVVLASDDGGLVDAVGSAGLLFRRGDLCDLVEKLNVLIHDPFLRAKLRDKALEHLPQFTHPVISRSYLAILEQLVNGGAF
jgi:glycosyltransferase involved in cell wall biosynthesis